MKRIMWAAMYGCLVVSCEKREMPVKDAEVNTGQSNTENVVNEPTRKFTFHLKGDFKTNYQDMEGGVPVVDELTDEWGEVRTRAGVRLEDSNAAAITDVWVLDYQDGALVQQVHQTAGQQGITFGSVPMNLTYGHHDIKFIASKGADAVLTSSSLTWGRVKDTFTLDYPVDVVASSNGNRAPELKRVISGLKVIMTDAVPQEAKYVVLTLGSRSQSLTLPGLSALPYSESSVELDCSGNRGVKGASAAIYTLAGDEEWTSTASISVKTEDGSVIMSFDLPEVTLKKNRMTVLTGEVFNRTNGFHITIDSTWDDDLTDTF